MLSMTLNSIKESNVLDVKVNIYTECGFCKDKVSLPELKIPYSIWAEWLYISHYMQKVEWGAVFWVKDGVITHYMIPKQEVSAGECLFKEELGGDGMVHSHHDMGAFHSSQDDAQARNLYTYSIVLSSTGSICTMRSRLPCKGFGYRDTELKLIDVPAVDFTLIEEKRYTGTGFGGEKASATKQVVYDYENEWTEYGEQVREQIRAQRQLELESKCDECNKYDCDNCEHYLEMMERTAS
jgi:hypothetical protein